MAVIVMKLAIGLIIFWGMVSLVPKMKIKQNAIRMFGKHFTYFIGGWEVTVFLFLPYGVCLTYPVDDYF